MASTSAEYIENLIMKLSSESDSGTKKVLITLTKLTKIKENVHLFCRKGGLKLLLALIQRPNKTIADMALSTLANCAREEECRREIRRLDGIVTLGDVLKTSEKTSILNRTSRALANLAEDELSVQVMEEVGLIPELVKLLMKTSDSDCQQSVLRALRMVCTTSSRKQAVLDLDAVKTVMELLKSDKPALVNCCIKTVAELTKGCSREMAQQIQDYGGVKYIVELANSDCLKDRQPALLSLVHLAHHAHVRVCIGSEGGIQSLTQQLKRKEPSHLTVKAVEGLCFCCREAVNRARVLESCALELFLNVLSSEKCLSLEKKIVSAFTCFYYSEPALEILLNGDLVPALINHLNRIISHVPSRSECEDHDDEFSDQLPFTSDFSSDNPLRATAIKDAFFDTSGEMTKDESFFKKLEETAREVTDSKVSGRLSNFKRRSGMKLKPSPIQTTPPPGVCTIGNGQSVFSFASRQTETTSLVSVCTYSRSTCISSVASLSSYQTNLSTSSYPSVVPSHHVSTLTISLCDSDEPKGLPAKDTELACNTSHKPTQECSRTPKTPIIQHNQSTVPAANSATHTTTPEGLLSPLSPKAHTALHHHRGPGHSALLLLLRISQMTDPSSLLVTKPCIQVLLDYLRLVDNPDPRCARLLNRLAKNPLCLKALIVNGSVVSVHHQLCCMYGESQEIATTSGNSIELQDSTHSLEEKSLQTPSSSGKTAAMCNTMPSSTQSYCQETGNHLLEILSSQAQTPFGRGVLENLLLKGPKGEREECVLALPLLCRTKKLRKVMLVERKGLRMFCDLFKSAAPNDETFTTAVECLVVLANDLQVQFPVKADVKEVTFSDGMVEMTENKCQGRDIDISNELHQAKRLKMDSSDSQVLLSKNIPKCIAVDQPDSPACPYSENSFGPQDVAFQMDSGDMVAAHKEVVKSACDVFDAMLSSRYLESTQSLIPIPDVSTDVFEFAVHYVYGCRTSAHNEQNPGKELLSVPCCCEVLRMHISERQRKGTEVQFFLELLTFSDRFMLDKLRSICEKFLIDLISASTVVQICAAGLHLNSPQLSVHCLSYLLNVRIANLPTYLHLFKELFLCVERGDIVEHVYQLLLSHLKL